MVWNFQSRQQFSIDVRRDSMPLFKGWSLYKHSWSPDQRQPLPLPARGVEMRDTQRIVLWQRQFPLGKVVWALDSSFLYSVLLLCLLDNVRERPQLSGLLLIHGHFLGALIQTLIWITPAPKLLPCWDIQFYSMVRCTLILPRVSGFDVQLHSWCLLESQTCRALDAHPPHESCPSPSLTSQARALPLSVLGHKCFFLSYSYLILEHGSPPNTSWIPHS